MYLKTKRLTSLLLALCMVIAMVPPFTINLVAFAAETDSTDPSDDWKYSLNADGTATLTKYTGTATDVYIPSTITDDAGERISVTALGEGVFKGNTGINSATFGEGITTIGASAFEGATNLVCIVSPETLTTIGDRAFYGCDAFNSVILYNAVTSIGMDAFAECPNVTVWVNEGSAAHTYVTANSIPFGILNPDATPETYVQDGVTYYITNGEAYAIGYDGSETEVTIQAMVEGYPVTELRGTFYQCRTLSNVTLPESLKTIGGDTFYYCNSLTSITIPNGVTSIGSYAFYSCTGLTDVTIPNSVTSIGDSAFFGCTSLSSIAIGDSVRSISNSAFRSCTSLTDVTIPDSVTSIVNYAFCGCTSLRSITIGDSVTSIGFSSFSSCTSLTDVTIPDSVTSIGDYAFSGCTSLTSITIPDSVTRISSYAFRDCTSLSSITIPNGENSISSYAFSGCTSLTDVTIPDSVKSIDKYAFRGCTSLSSITIPDSVTSIGSYAFSGCTNLSSITIGDSVTSIGSYAFSGCTKLNTIVIPESVKTIYSGSFPAKTTLYVYENSSAHTFAVKNNLPYVLIIDDETPQYTVDGVAYYISNGEAAAISFDQSTTTATIPSTVNGCPVTDIGKTFSNCTSLTSITIPDSVTSIDDSAFDGCTRLSSITIGDGVTSIGSYAFSGCRSLRSITIPDSVTSIGKYAFEECYNLSSITIGDSVTSIGAAAFMDCLSLSSITIGDSVTSIGNSAFYNCTKLSSITIPNRVTSIGDSAFSDCTSLRSITIPDSVKSIGDSAFRDCTSLRSITIGDSVTSISSHTFYNCTSLSRITIGDSVTSIGNSAFYNCTSLRSITIPDSVMSIGSSAFSGCTSLSSITIGDSVTSILAGAFFGCASLSSITIPDSITSIDRNIFSGCASLTDVTIPDSVTSILDGAFSGCTSLSNITIPRSVKSIDSSAFSGCTSLGGVTILGSVTSIDSYTFYDCASLSSITIPDSVTTIDDCVFKGCTNLKSIVIPKTVISMNASAFEKTTILCVYKDSYAHTFAVENNLLYFIIREINNPEIAYGSSISGTVTLDGSPVSGATVELLYDDGVVKETVTTDENGAYAFTYAEVGAYTVRATFGSVSGTEKVSVKRMNAFDVFLSGETDIVLKGAYTVSGNVSPVDATVTLTDTDGNVIETLNVTNGTYSFANVPNGSYIVKAETESGNAVHEVTVFNANVTVEDIVIASESAVIKGIVSAEARDGSIYVKNYASVTLRDSNGIVTAQTKTAADGSYSFNGVASGKYFIAAEAEEQRPDRFDTYQHPHKLSGSAHVEISGAGDYTADITIREAGVGARITVSGKVTAQGETQPCRVILSDVSGNEIAKCQTGNNGKYTFTSVDDGTYFITAITPSDGMGFTVITVRDGNISGDTDFHVWKDDKVKNHEELMATFMTGCTNAEIAKTKRDWIALEKRWYDSLSAKEKKQCSEEYVKSLMQLIEWITELECVTPDSATLSGGGDVLSGAEIESDDTFTLTLEITDGSETEIGEDGIQTSEQFVQQSINNAAGDNEIIGYYDITLTKENGDGTAQQITSIARDTDTTGKVRIMMDIPEEFRGHKHYHFVHVHNGEPMTLVDLDDNPDTITFEVDRFSTFALTYTDEVLSIDGEVEEEPEETVNPTIGYSMQANLTLENEVLMNICFRLENTGDKAMTEFVDNVGVLMWEADKLPNEEDATYENCDTVVTDVVYSTVNSRFEATCPGIPAKKLGDAVAFRAFYRNDDGTCTYGRIIPSYSPKTYCYNKLKNEDATDDEIMVAILNYGAAAQMQFEYRIDELMNADLTEEQKALNWDGSLVRSDWSVPEEKAGSFVRSSAVTSRGANLTLLGAIDYTYYAAASGAEIVDAKILCWTESDYNATAVLSEENASLVTDMTYVPEKSRYEYTYKGLPAKRMFSPIYACAVLTASDGNVHYSGVVAYCPERFSYINESNMDVNLANMAKRIVIYGDAARRYFDK